MGTNSSGGSATSCESQVLKDTFQSQTWEDYDASVNQLSIHSEAELRTEYDRQKKEGSGGISIPGLGSFSADASFDQVREVYESVKRYQEERNNGTEARHIAAFETARVSRPDQVRAWLACQALQLGKYRWFEDNVDVDPKGTVSVRITYTPPEGGVSVAPKFRNVVIDPGLTELNKGDFEKQLRAWGHVSGNGARTAIGVFALDAARTIALINVGFANAYGDVTIVVLATQPESATPKVSKWIYAFEQCAAAPLVDQDYWTLPSLSWASPLVVGTSGARFAACGNNATAVGAMRAMPVPVMYQANGKKVIWQCRALIDSAGLACFGMAADGPEVSPRVGRICLFGLARSAVGGVQTKPRIYLDAGGVELLGDYVTSHTWYTIQLVIECLDPPQVSVMYKADDGSSEFRVDQVLQDKLMGLQANIAESGMLLPLSHVLIRLDSTGANGIDDLMVELP